MIIDFAMRSGTTAQWTANDRVLDPGEPGYDINQKIFKVGDGVSKWSELNAQTYSPEALNAALTEIEAQRVLIDAAVVETQTAAAEASAIGTTTDTAVASTITTSGTTATKTAVVNKIDERATPRNSFKRPEDPEFSGALAFGGHAAAIQAAIEVLKTAGGGILELMMGKDYLCSVPVDFSSLEGVEVRTAGPTVKGVKATGKPTHLIYTGTEAIAFKTYETANLIFRGINFRYNSNDFTGTLIKAGHPDKATTADTTGLTFDRCTFGGKPAGAGSTVSASTVEPGLPGAYNAFLLVDLCGTDTTVFETCSFYAAQYSVGRTDMTIFADVATFNNCKFAPTVTKAHILNPGSSWTFFTGRVAGCMIPGGNGTRNPAFMRFDPDNTLVARSIGSVRIIGMQFQDCTTPNSDAWIHFEGRNITILGCHVAQGGVGSWLMRLTDTTESVVVEGTFINTTNGIDYNGKTCYGAVWTGNAMLGDGVQRANTVGMRSYLQAGGYSAATDGGTVLGGLTSQKIGFYGNPGTARPNIPAGTSTDPQVVAIVNGLRALGLFGTG